MRYLKLRYEDREKLLDALKKLGKLYGPKKISAKTHNFREISRWDEMDLSYVRTIAPPKKFVYPQREILFTVDREKGTVDVPEIDDTPIVLFGLHHCDVEGLKRLDSVFMGYPADYYYSRRRQNVFIVGYDCMPDEYCACNVTHTSFSSDGFDMFLHPLPDGWLVRVASEKAQAVADEVGMTDISADDMKHANDLPILPRGAGTSLAGQTVAEAIVIDFSRHMTQILEIDVAQKTATVQPGLFIRP